MTGTTLTKSPREKSKVHAVGWCSKELNRVGGEEELESAAGSGETTLSIFPAEEHRTQQLVKNLL